MMTKRGQAPFFRSSAVTDLFRGEDIAGLIRKKVPVPFLLFMSLVCLTAGCNRGGPSAAAPANTPAPPQPIPEPTGPFAAGQKVYNANCIRCHGVPGQTPAAPQGGPMAMNRGPGLKDVGSKRSRDWIVEHVKNPKTHNPQSKMLAFESRLKPDDLNALADYLVSLK